MVTYKDARSIVLNEHPDSVVVGAMELESGYLFSLEPKEHDEDKKMFKLFFKVDRNGRATKVFAG